MVINHLLNGMTLPVSMHLRLEEIIQTIRSFKERDQGKQESNKRGDSEKNSPCKST